MVQMTTYRTNQRNAQKPTLAPLSVIRTETVFSKLPIHTLSKKGSVDIHITRENKKGKLETYWRVSPNRDFGEPRQLALDIAPYGRTLQHQPLYQGPARCALEATHLQRCVVPGQCVQGSWLSSALDGCALHISSGFLAEKIRRTPRGVINPKSNYREVSVNVVKLR